MSAHDRLSDRAEAFKGATLGECEEPRRGGVVMRGAMPHTADGKTRFPSRSDGYEAGIIQGTITVVPAYDKK